MKYIFMLIVVCIFIAPASSCLAWIDMCIDPGHGGDSAPGCVTVIPSYYERHVNLSVALALHDYIENIGYYSAVYTRTTDEYIDNKLRPLIADWNDPYTFISIHHNCVANDTIQQIHSLYSSTATTPHDPSIPAYDTLYIAGSAGIMIRYSL